MSFAFEWPEFSESFYADAREMLAQALNKGQKPPIIADRIEVKELDMGTIPPDLEILEIGDLSTDRFRGIFRLTYSGDAYIVLQTKVQANPLNVPRPSVDILGTPRILYAAAPLVVPMTLRLSNLSLRAIVVLVVSRQKGITLVFKNDPLESVEVSSSFDGVESVAGFIQREIEAQLREAFRSDLPSVIHRLSQKWLSGEVKSAGKAADSLGPKARVGLAQGFDKHAKIETRTAYDPTSGATAGIGPDGVEDRRAPARGRGYTTRMSGPSEAGESVELASQADTAWSTWGGENRMGSTYSGSGGSFGRTPSLRRQATTTAASASASASVRHDMLDSVPESIENYDPTYGLRQDAIPHHANFADYERLAKAGSSRRGLGDLLEVDEEDPFTARSPPEADYDWELVGGFDEDPRHEYVARYETIPAVGGGTITRPRVFHTQSQMRMRTASTGSLSAHGSPSSYTARSAAAGSTASTIGLGRSASFGQLTPLDAGLAAPSLSGASSARFPFPKYPPPPAYSAGPSASLLRNTSLPSLSRYAGGPLHRSSYSSASASPDFAQQSLFNSNDPSAYSSPPSSLASPAVPPHHPPAEPDDPPELAFTRPSPVDLLSRSPSSVLNTSFLDEEHMPITLNPSGNDSCAHLATLTTSNQTLSPFTRDHSHVTARSSPYIAGRLAPSAPLAGANGRVAILPGGTDGSANRQSAPPTPAQPVKAVRKRLHRIGSARATPAAGSPALATPSLVSASASAAPSPALPSTPAFSRHQSMLSSSAASARQRAMSPLRSGVTLASEYGSSSGLAHGLGAVGVGAAAAAARAPSELSDYFPPSGAREMLARMGLGGMGSPRR
ncbi:ERMES complex subunit MDM34 [Rhodotorula paludigena]|uniref:ERMES complex subunit MDM34 n=1 Tax=Rhodotorula paludigena TaxID=86838 RepID=UPI00317BC5A0